MTAEEILDMQIEHYKRELQYTVKSLYRVAIEKPDWTSTEILAIQSARQTSNLSSLLEVKFIMLQNKETEE